jgi:hypothetical protein
VQCRLLTHTLHALTKLTDAANSLPQTLAPTPRTRPQDALASSIFTGPPVMPFSSLSAGGDAALELPISGGGLGEGAQDASSEWGQMAAAELWSLPERRRGLSTAQLQRIVVAQGYWPRDYAQMSVRLQRQVLADAVRYCIAGGPALEPEQSLLFGEEGPPPEKKKVRPGGAAAAAAAANPPRPMTQGSPRGRTVGPRPYTRG